MDNTEKIYTTRSLQVASFLFSRPEIEGISLVGFDESDPRSILFKFTPFNDCVILNDKYLMNNIECNPKKIMEAHATLKEKIFSIQRSLR